MKPQFSLLKRISGLGGVSSFVSQIAVAVTMTVVNYYLVHCGAESEYGSDIPLAAFGIVMKFNTILTSIVTGIGTGSQPIVGYNYGSGDHARVRKSFYLAAQAATITGIVFFLVFEFLPYQLTALFGNQGDLYTAFSVIILKDRNDVLRVFIYSDMEKRMEHSIHEYGMSPKTAREEIERSDRERARHYSSFTDKKWGDRHNYDLMLNSGELGYDYCAKIICSVAGMDA
ncbi:MAG: cytidylate kinase family protein [Lachnospiraceae bacterium]|nr:cytidylate kinase family protein [Lachnospiraceae bacterium]